MSRNSVYLSSGDSDLWVALTVHPGSQAWSLVEVKNSDLLSSCHGYLLEIIDWPQRSQASCGILRGDSALLSRPCRKRRASFHDDRGISWFFSHCGATCEVSLELPKGTQGASRVAPGKSSLHLSCEERLGIALESRQSNRASIHDEGGISRSFLSCGRKLWGPSSCQGDLRELLLVPIGIQESFHVVRGISGFLWCRYNGRGPHLLFNWEIRVPLLF